MSIQMIKGRVDIKFFSETDSIKNKNQLYFRLKLFYGYICIKNAKTNQVYKVPDSEHLRLFPKSRDFDQAIRMIAEICGMGPV